MKTIKIKDLSISLCLHCYCMTKTIKGKCGKCGKNKDKYYYDREVRKSEGK